MATESTAIHNLLSGFNRKAIPDDPDDDVLFAGSRRRDGETAPKQLSQQPRAGMFTLPPPPPAPPMDVGSPYAAAPRAPAGTPAFAAPPARMPSGTQPPPYAHTVIPAAPGVPTMQLNVSPQMVVPLPQAFVRHPAHAIQEAHATIRVSKSSAWNIAAAGVNKKLYAIPVALFVIAVVLAGVLLTSSDKPAKKVAAVAPIAEPIEAKEEPAAAEPVAAPAALPVAAAEPVAAAVVPNKDMIAPPTVVPESTFTAKYEPTVPTVTATPIDVPKPAPAAVVASAPAPSAKATPVASKVKKSKRELARERRAARAAKRAKPRVAVAEPVKAVKTEKAAKAGTEDLNGNGALAITSASPREVWVDGKNSKRMTPLRVLLKPGKHKVTLFDKDHGSAKTFEVEIKADATTKVSK